MIYSPQVVERFKTKFDVSKGCWLWKGARDGWGYGSFGFRFNGKSFALRANRVAYQIFKGDIPKGMLVCHTCDTPACVNPQHLFLGTNKDNVDDMVRKGRRPDLRGEQARNVKLTNNDVLDIRRVYVPGSMQFGQVALSRKYGVGRTAIQGIITKRTWKHI